MKDENKSKEQLIEELQSARKRITELEVSVPKLIHEEAKHLDEEYELCAGDPRYLVDDPNREYQKLIASIQSSGRYKEENKRTCLLILDALHKANAIHDQELLSALGREGLPKPNNLVEFVHNRINRPARLYGFNVKRIGQTHQLFYEPPAQAFIFFVTRKAGDTEHLVKILLKIEHLERDKLKAKGINILRAATVIGDFDAVCEITAESVESALAELMDIFRDSQKVHTNSGNGNIARANDIISRTRTYVLVPGEGWHHRDRVLA